MVPSNANHLFLRNMLHYMVSVTKIFIFYLVLLLIKNEVLYPFSDFFSIYFMKKKFLTLLGYMQVFVLISKSIFYFTISCLGQYYNFSLKVARKLPSVIFKFSMISAWHLPLRAVFYWFYDFICRHHIFGGIRVKLKWIYFST